MSPSVITGEFAGRYTVERELGRGATSTVWLARDREHGRPVALKILREELATDIAAERFLREVRVTAQLHHPHIVPVLNSGTHEGRLFFVLPYLDGGTLRARLQRDKQLPVAEVVAIGLTIASALAAAHEKNVLHRDVKPENILFTAGQACLADFGIARAIVHASGESTTSTGLVRGTPAYMSPEQASGDRDYDGRSDLYSLACVLYEALAGVPAFVGATSQQIVAQRLLHEPRPVRVYRPTASSELERVLQRALSTSPADRFQTAKEFADALASASVVTGSADAVVGRVRRWPTLAVVAAAVAALSFVATKTNVIDRITERWAVLDTTRLAILRFDAPPGAVAPFGLLHEAMRRWKGITVVESFEVEDALRRFGVPSTPAQARLIARRLGAGRYVIGRLADEGDRSRMTASLFETRTGRLLYSTSLLAPRDSTYVLSPYLGIGDSIALRGAGVTGVGGVDASTHNADAVAAMLRGAAALGDWNLPLADSAYSMALDREPNSSRAAFWTAQVRAWREPALKEPWRALASRAARSDTSLTRVEQRLAAALDALGDGNYPRACAVYDTLTKSSPHEFAAWFGLGQCIDNDRLVVADPSRKSGWRFRSSYQQAIDAYLHAFELLPSVYRAYQGAAFSRLGNLLYVNFRNRRAGADSTKRRFAGAPVLDGDTIVFAVYPVDVIAALGSQDDQAAISRAVLHSRRVFQRITASWAAAFPTSPAAKEGLALSLDLQGDPAAIDSMRSAIRLARDPQQRLHLVGELAWMQLKFGLPDRLDLLRAARRAADSAISATRQPGHDATEVLALFAALSGHCSAAAEFAREGTLNRGDIPGVAQQVYEGAAQRLALVALGCGIPAGVPSLEDLSTAAMLDQAPPATRLSAWSRLFGREVRTSDSLDVTWAVRLAPAGDFLITARLDAERGRPDSARARLLPLEMRRRDMLRGTVTPDAVVPEARLWLTLGDTTHAARWLDDVLRNARFISLQFNTEVDNLVLVASTVRAMALRAQISRDPADARRWARAVLALWDGSDAPLQPTIRALRRLAQ